VELQRKNETMSLKHALWRDVELFGTEDKNENKDGKWCILTVFKTIWNFLCQDLWVLSQSIFIAFLDIL